MNKIKEKYLSYIDEKIAEYKRSSKVYKSEGRSDEANLEMVKAKIFELFKTLFIVDTIQLDGKDLSRYNDINLFADYLSRFETIPANWMLFMNSAKDSGDSVRQIIEKTKLAAAQELKEKFILTVKEELRANT